MVESAGTITWRNKTNALLRVARYRSAIESIERDFGFTTIAQRLSPEKNADRIHANEVGEIIESGRHHDLVNTDGKYAELYAIQSRAG